MRRWAMRGCHPRISKQLRSLSPQLAEFRVAGRQGFPTCTPDLPWTVEMKTSPCCFFAAKCHGHPHGNDQSRSTLPLPGPEHVGIVPYLPMEPGQLLWLYNEKNNDKKYQKRELKEYIPTSSAWDSTILALPLCWLFLLPSQRGGSKVYILYMHMGCWGKNQLLGHLLAERFADWSPVN